MVVRVLYTVLVFQNVLHYDTIQKVLESYGREEKLVECIVQNLMETHRTYWKLLISYRSWALLAPTLTHITTRDPVISGAEDRAMSYVAPAT